jgi:hypothetical protein
MTPTPPHPRLVARARRVAQLRRRVVATALASFALAWGAIAYQGSLGTASTTAATQSTSASTTQSDSDSSTTQSDSGTSTTQSDTPSAVTTQQS